MIPYAYIYKYDTYVYIYMLYVHVYIRIYMYRHIYTHIYIYACSYFVDLCCPLAEALEPSPSRLAPLLPVPRTSICVCLMHSV